jgi:hypothetical protein
MMGEMIIISINTAIKILVSVLKAKAARAF